MRKQIWTTAAGLALAASLHAQTNPVDIEAYRVATVKLVAALPAWETPLLSGHPYSAVERRVTLSPDGKNIDHSDSQAIYRDDQGRTRREMNGGKTVWITDPVAGVAYTLNVESKTVMKRTLPPENVERQTTVASQSYLEMATKQAGRQGATVEDLGTQMVNGVSAQGVRTTTTVEKGAVGNDRDLHTVMERWVSPDLRVIVRSVNTNPDRGAVHLDLTNLVVGSPDPSLFEVPAGYTVVEPGGGRGGRRGAQ